MRRRAGGESCLRSSGARRVAACAAALLAALVAAPRAASAQGGDPRPNFVVILTDDQRFDSLWAMPLLQQELIARGVHFREAFVTTPVCCPMRANFLAGGYRSESTNVLDNQEPNGGVLRFQDGTTLATRLQATGYATGLIGKYMNGYPAIEPYVPPGWTFWHAALNVPLLPPGPFVTGSSGATSSVGQRLNTLTQYGTDYIRDRALDFIDAHQNEPFFLYVSMGAPHTPSTPAPQDAALFPDYLHRGRAWGEPDVSDKPLRIQIAAQQFASLYPAADVLHRDMLRTLQAVDRAVQAIVARLVERGLLGETYVMFLSDNGYLWGEHHLFGKTQPYEESMRVPLVVVAPGVAPRTDDRLVAANLDLPATIQELAGLPVQSDGVSLVPLLADPQLPGRQETLLSFTPQWEVWSALRVREAIGDWKYIEWSRGSRELYDLGADPYEENNLASVPAHQAVRANLAARLAAVRGLAVTTHFVPSGRIGQPYTAQLTRWGGVAPFAWSIHAGQLPNGLSLDPATGLVSGVPTQSETQSVTFRVADSSTGLHSGGPQTYDQVLSFRILEACDDGLDNDADGLVDLLDPGCSAATDPSEKAASLPCDDGADNDGDSLVDLADGGCESLLDTSEGDPATACADGLDNDGDALVDAADTGCESPADTAETDANVACDDGADNDGDGLVDRADPGCPHSQALLERPKCDDGLDNDGDGAIDFADSYCRPDRVGSEAPRAACGFGVELVGLLALLARLARIRG
ncbi:MAG: hypothetical protein DCC71_20065 [Proteobacteria bacterium]|nr:MAG: hypothetical protein DCC71_20065 [Pseudomonadota bacterium]